MENGERKSEARGKSWKREREERGSRRMNRFQNVANTEPTACSKDSPKQKSDDVEESAKVVNEESLVAENETTTDDLKPIVSETVTGEEAPVSIENVPEEQSAIPDVSPENMSNDEEEKAQLDQYIVELNERFLSKAELRATNQRLASDRPEEGFFTKLDSSLKKNTAFVKRLRNMTEAQRESLLKDMTGLNLTKYISEVAAAIVEAKLKMSDVATAVQICSLLHQRYAEFGLQLLENWQKILPMKKDEKIVNPSKIRVDLRFYAELITCGVFTLKEGLPILGNLLTVITSGDKEEHLHLNILLSFCKHCGEDYAGLVPRKIRLLAEKHEVELPKSDVRFLTAERQKGLRTLLKDYYKSLSRHVVKDHKALGAMERQNNRTLETKGELATERKDKFEAAQAAFLKLLQSTQQFAEIIDEDLPDLPKDESLSPETDITSLDVHNRFRDNEDGSGNSLWEDDDTRCFYESLPDLKASIPGILFKDSGNSQIIASKAAEISETAIEEELNKLDLADLEAEASEADQIVEVIDDDKLDTEDPSLKDDIIVESEQEIAEKILQAIEEQEDDPIKSPGPGASNEDQTTGTATSTKSQSSSNKVLLECFLNNLLHSVNREMIDQSAVEFCTNLNTKPNRRKLVRALFLVPRTRLDLLPFYARFVAVLAPCMPDVANDLVSMLKRDFQFHVKKKDQINIESKVKSARFIGELVKFGIFPKNEALFCLKMLLSDFRHHNIDMACNLLETCGRFLFRSPESHARTKVYLEQMMRKKGIMAIDSRYATMVENAFYYCNPPEAPAMVRIERPPLHNYIRRLLYKDLSKNSTEKILRQMRKLDWDNPDVNSYATKCLTSIWNVKFYNIRCVANLLAGLVAYQETVGPQVVDGVLEDIRLGMEIDLPKYNQRRVSMVRYLGELYNYRMVESSVVFRVLYSFITFGVNYDGSHSELDPPESLFRLRLVSTLLDTCGQYFNNGSSKKKLDCYLVFFQRYYQQKRCNSVFGEAGVPFPVTVSLMVKDTINALRPKLKLYETLEEADNMVEELLEEFKPKLVEVLPPLVGNDMLVSDSDAKLANDALGPIQEEEDDYEFGSDQEEILSGSQSQTIEENDAEEQKTGEDLNQGSVSDEEKSGQEGIWNRERKNKFDTDEELGEDGSGANLSIGEGTDNVTLLNSKPKLVQCQEDEDFMAAFDKMLTESIMHRTQEPVKPQVDIVIPMNIKSGHATAPLSLKSVDSKNIILSPSDFPGLSSQVPAPIHVPQILQSSNTNMPTTSNNGKSTISFLLMTRKGNKPQFKSLELPTTSELAQNLKDREKAELAEKEQVKKLTLNINERQEEEDYQEMIAAQQRPVVMNLNRDRRHRYQHPKGAPDVDLIFGNKKR